MSNIQKKISELFEYRRLPWMLEQEFDQIDSRRKFLNVLKDLQYVIFLYDKQLESSWELDHDLLSIKWKDIELSLSQLLGPEERLQDYLSEIQIYAENEMRMRQGFLLSDIAIETFYYYKSCDVRLMRRLILERACSEDEAKERLADWRLYDLVAEVNDDVMDLEEDVDTFNGNRFLHGMRYGEVRSTHQEYLRFLGGCRTKVWEQINRREGHFDIHQKTLEEIKVLEALIPRKIELMSTLADQFDKS
ncbi:MAG: hypothetical protein R3275_07670 [Saprospiraceae bacterium]|nr:hypothetical protein [Saprospiraceae bacterium]